MEGKAARNAVKFQHLKPLSVYSRMDPACSRITCGQKATVNQPVIYSNPFIDFKIDVANSCGQKRKFHYDCPDEGYDSLAKRSFNPNAVSSDLGSFIDHCSPRSANTVPSVPLHPKHVECWSSTESGSNEEDVHQSFTHKNVVLNLLPAFDCDVDDILCLNLVGISSAGGSSRHEEGCRYSNTSQNKPQVNVLAVRQELERGDGLLEEGREELKKEMYLNEKDEGYFSISYMKQLKLEKNPTQSANPQLPTAAATPLHRKGGVEWPQDECYPESSSEQAAVPGKNFSFSASDLCPAVIGPSVESAEAAADFLEADVEEMWNIGAPMFESSMCHSLLVTCNASSEVSRQVREDVDGGAGDDRQPVFCGDKTTSDTSYETTLPLQVQVRSVVVVPTRHTNPSNPRRPRPTLFQSKEDFEKEKKLYVRSVISHMKEISGENQASTELLDLMAHVAKQTSGSDGTAWQHPSDLTRRNYERRFGNTKAKTTLSEWQAKNQRTHKRFSSVPKIFVRSPFP